MKTKIMALAAKKGENLLQKEKREASDHESEPGAKKVALAGSSRLNSVPLQKSKAKPSKKKGQAKEDVSEEEAVVEGTTLPPELQLVADELKSVPKCFFNLSIPRIIGGEKLMRSVEAARVPAFYRLMLVIIFFMMTNILQTRGTYCVPY